MAIVSNEKLTEVFSLALEDRSRGYADLVSNSNAILAKMKEKGGWKTFSGPTIRERLLYAESGTYVRYSGYDFLNPKPAELFNDAEFAPKLAAVSVTLSGEDILKNSGTNQLKDVMEEHISAAETELQDRFVEDLHSNGTLPNQVGGLQIAVPTVNNSGTFGGISRATVPLWRTGSYVGAPYWAAPPLRVGGAADHRSRWGRPRGRQAHRGLHRWRAEGIHQEADRQAGAGQPEPGNAAGARRGYRHGRRS